MVVVMMVLMFLVIMVVIVVMTAAGLVDAGGRQLAHQLYRCCSDGHQAHRDLRSLSGKEPHAGGSSQRDGQLRIGCTALCRLEDVLSAGCGIGVLLEGEERIIQCHGSIRIHIAQRLPVPAT